MDALGQDLLLTVSHRTLGIPCGAFSDEWARGRIRLSDAWSFEKRSLSLSLSSSPRSSLLPTRIPGLAVGVSMCWSVAGATHMQLNFVPLCLQPGKHW